MNLIIDGLAVNMSIKGTGNSDLKEKTLSFLSANEPFHLYSKNHKGLVVIPAKLITWDQDNMEAIKSETVDQFQWVLQCAMIVYDQVKPYFAVMLPDNVQRLLE